jgi:hypothetical protein
VSWLRMPGMISVLHRSLARPEVVGRVARFLTGCLLLAAAAAAAALPAAAAALGADSGERGAC